MGQKESRVVFPHYNWDPDEVERVLKEIMEWPHEKDFQDRPIKILMCGKTGFGKSSFINSLISALRKQIVHPSHSAKLNTTVTSKLCVIKPFPEKSKFYFEFMDMPGLMGLIDVEVKDKNLADEANLRNIVSGHIKLGAQFIAGEKIDENSPYYNQIPEAMDVPCCVVLIWKAGAHPSDAEKRCFRILHEQAAEQNLKTLLVLTHIDNADDTLKKDITALTSSESIENIILAAKAQWGFEVNYILPVKNFTNEMAVEDHMRYLHLWTLNRILTDARFEALKRMNP